MRGGYWGIMYNQPRVLRAPLSLDPCRSWCRKSGLCRYARRATQSRPQQTPALAFAACWPQRRIGVGCSVCGAASNRCRKLQTQHPAIGFSSRVWLETSAVELRFELQPDSSCICLRLDVIGCSRDVQRRGAASREDSKRITFQEKGTFSRKKERFPRK
eukprot:4329471-Pleurochrysis_carterae.AAC.1